MSRCRALALSLALFGVLPAGAGSAAEPAPSAGPRPVVERPFVIAIDPGHGGTNEGCRAWDGHAHEKQVTLALAVAVKDAIARRLPHARVVLTRERDETLTLTERVDRANAAGADVFVSLHANASPDATQVGFETYVLDARASNVEAARTARRENGGAIEAPRREADDGAAPVEASMMLAELALAGNRSRAAWLAAALQREQAERFPDRVDRGVKQAPFDVLMGARMPAVLFEAGFLDHGDEGRLLTEAQGRDEVARGVAEALVEYYRLAGRLG